MTDIAQAPVTNPVELRRLIKSARDIMRKDKGLNGDLDRLPMLTWIMFLKFIDDAESIKEEDAELAGIQFRPAIEPPYRWRDWASDPEGLSGDELTSFINSDTATRSDGTEGPGLFAYLRSLDAKGGDLQRRDVIATAFRGVTNRMASGYLLRDVLAKVDGIHFSSSEETQTLGHLYESMLQEVRDAAGDSGEFYTPRPLIRFMVDVIDPRLGETVYDPACGTGGFLAEAFMHLKEQCASTEDVEVLQSSIRGGEAKSLPYLLAQMNLLLHGLESPTIDPLNSLRFPLREIGESDRVDVILTNPPFGGEEERGVLANFPADKQTSETALLFLQLIMRKLRREGESSRAAVVVPNTTLFYPGIAGLIRREILTDFNLRAVVRLPLGVFEPYTDIETNLLFLDSTGATDKVLFYRLDPPDGRKKYTKMRPLRVEDLNECRDLLRADSDDSPRAWWVNAKAILATPEAMLDIHNPKAPPLAVLPPDDLVASVKAGLADLEDLLEGSRNAIASLDQMLSSRDAWDSLRLGNVLSRRRDAIQIEDDETYKRITIQVKGRGVLLRDQVPGKDIGTKRQFVVHEGQFALSKIDARNGAFGIVPQACDGAVITGNFWVFDVDLEAINPKLLHYLTQSDAFRQFCINASPGATNRRYLQEDQFLAQEATFPKEREDQDRLCELLDQISTIGKEGEGRAAIITSDFASLLRAALHAVFGGDVIDISEEAESTSVLDEALSVDEDDTAAEAASTAL